ncbi:sensor histidine kinase [Flavobacterium croceum]|uniref:sensor histidine kinase n=1 Tax=Flavobacterium croceum TaxID=370975 RepID=UPI0024A9DF08|nr:HAMP domain-containing sensor histidine kinase [Flavobacterium croceum]
MYKLKNFKTIIIIGLTAIISILIVQLLWTKQAYNLEEKKFSQKVHIALLEVAKKLYEGINHDFPTDTPVKKIANDYYVVNIDNDFQPEILEHYLKTEFSRFNINTDFEYAMYNCQSDEMVYGDYISVTNEKPSKINVHFPKHKNLVYYFAIRFPNETSYLFASLRFWFVLSFALVLILLIYVYSIYTIIQQKKYSELQRDFINNMTHEFKTPLSSILLASNYLQKNEKIGTDDKLNNYTKIIINQTKKLNNHIEKILDIAKTDDDIMKLDKKKINAHQLISDVIEDIQIKNEAVTIKNNIAHNIEILADEFHFTNILYNLIDNSIKYCNQTPVIEISSHEEKNSIIFECKDNGIGVPNTNLQEIFDKFYRVPNIENNKQITGFGLGLFYVKKICDKHQWKISAKNNTPTGLIISLMISKK